MKVKILLLLLCISSLITFLSCEDNFDAKIYGSLSTTNFPKSKEDYQNYLLSCYIPFYNGWGYSFNSWQHTLYVPEGGVMRMLDMTSDLCAPANAAAGWGAGWIGMSTGDFTTLEYAARGSSGNLPSHFEKVRDVTRFTEIINNLENASDAVLSQIEKEQFVGEARLCRGLLLYYLLHFYGPVPVIVDPSLVGNSEAESRLVRPSLSEYTQYITDDMEYAANYMTETQSEKGRYTADYARFCLMRHYLNEGYHMSGYYQKAYDLYAKFTGNYALFTTGNNPYAQQFMIANKFNIETIMSVSSDYSSDYNFNPLSWYIVPGNAARVDSKGNRTPFYYQGGGWAHCFNIDVQFYDTFEENDLRRETILDSYYDSRYGWIGRDKVGDVWDGFIINKYPIEMETNFAQDTDIPLARWADVMLMYAEASVRLNNIVSPTAISCVNQVRSRAGLEGLSTQQTSSVGNFLNALLQERGHELMYEGHRKVDMIRFNKYYTIMRNFGRTPSSQYFPIPFYATSQAQESGYTLTQYYTRDNYDGPAK